jgi:hypothetical protein
MVAREPAWPAMGRRDPFDLGCARLGPPANDGGTGSVAQPAGLHVVIRGVTIAGALTLVDDRG